MRDPRNGSTINLWKKLRDDLLQKTHEKLLKILGGTLVEITGITPVEVLVEIPGRTFEKRIAENNSRRISDETLRETP